MLAARRLIVLEGQVGPLSGEQRNRSCHGHILLIILRHIDPDSALLELATQLSIKADPSMPIIQRRVIHIASSTSCPSIFCQIARVKSA
jgi:hypothetical protein